MFKQLVSSFVLLLAACLGPVTVGSKVPVVPSAEAPVPDPGEGWSCFAWSSSAGVASSTCTRQEAKCTEAKDLLAQTTVGGHQFQTGTCVAQAEAICKYVWQGDVGSHECYASDADCARAQEDRRIDGATKQSRCTRYR